MSLTISSEAFAGGGEVPVRYTCDGEDVSPPLAWSGAPAGTAAFAIVVDDPDAPGGVFTHWMLADLPPRTTHLALGGTAGLVGRNDFGRVDYGGPCPPGRHGPHRYRFTVHALERRLGLASGYSREAFDRAVSGHVLATATLTATYRRAR